MLRPGAVTPLDRFASVSSQRSAQASVDAKGPQPFRHQGIRAVLEEARTRWGWILLVARRDIGTARGTAQGDDRHLPPETDHPTHLKIVLYVRQSASYIPRISSGPRDVHILFHMTKIGEQMGRKGGASCWLVVDRWPPSLPPLFRTPSAAGPVCVRETTPAPRSTF